MSSTTISYPAFSPKDPDEDVFLAFDFAALTDAPLSPEVTATRHAGAADANPSAILSGAPIVQGAKVIQKAIDGTAGTDYAIRCKISTDEGSVYILAGVLPVRAA